MKGSIAIRIDLMDLKEPGTILEEVVDDPGLVTLRCEMQTVYSQVVLYLQVGSQDDQLLDQGQIPIEGGEVNCCKLLIVAS